MTTDNVEYIINSEIICLPDRYPALYQCSICLANFSHDEESDPKKTCETNCFHAFHIDCIKQWSSYGNSNCPFCKQYIHSLNPVQFRTEEEYKEIQRGRSLISLQVNTYLSQEDNIYIDNLSLEDLNAEIFISIRGAGDSFPSVEAYEYHINYHMRLEERAAQLDSIERETDYIYNMHMGIQDADYIHRPPLHSLTRSQLERLFTPIENE